MDEIKHLDSICNDFTYRSTDEVRFFYTAVTGDNLKLNMIIDENTGHLISKKRLCRRIHILIQKSIKKSMRNKQIFYFLENVAFFLYPNNYSYLHSKRKNRPQFLWNLFKAREDLYWKSRKEGKLFGSGLPDDTGDKHLTEVCVHTKNNYLTLPEFRVYLMKQPKRRFKGKKLGFLHLFRPSGEPRRSISEICWAIHTIGNPKFFGLFGK